MYRILIVEDEKIIRDGFARVVSEIDAFSVEAVRSGEEALTVIGSEPIDAMLLDIRLPGMSGLDVLDTLRDQGIDDLPTIIISGFNDFDYARRAVELHVFEYILKPVTPSRIREVTASLKETLDRRSRRQKDIQAMELKILHSRPLLKEHYFADLLDSGQEEAELRERAEFLELGLGSSSLYRVTVVKPREAAALTGGEIQRQTLHQAIRELLSDFSWPAPVECFSLTTGSFALVQTADGQPLRPDEDEILLRRAAYLVRRETGIGVVLGIGSWVDSLTGIRESYSQACSALTFHEDEDFGNLSAAFTGFDPCRYYRQQGTREYSCRKEAGESNGLYQALAGLDEQEVHRCIAAGSENLPPGGSPLDGLEFSICSLASILAAQRDYGPGIDEELGRELDGLLGLLRKRASFAYGGQLETICRLVMDRIRTRRTLQRTSLVRRTKDYIITHYAEEMRLSRLAALLGYSPNHLGAAFKKETGRTVHEFWHAVRIDKAKQLLQNRSIMIAEVAEQVGYQDQYYFSNVFKRYAGVSPKQFRTG